MERSDLEEYAGRVLTEEEAEAMAVPLTGLMDSHGWGIYLDVLKRYRIQAREGFESAQDMTAVRYIKGLIDGLTLASNAPVEILQFVEKNQNADHARREGRERMRREVLMPGGDDSF